MSMSLVFKRTEANVAYFVAPTGMKTPRLRSSMHTELFKLKDWDFPVDNAFSVQFRAQASPDLLPGLNNAHARLCQRCTDLDFEAGGFSLEESLSRLASSAIGCDFCRMLETACKQDKAFKGDYIQLERNQSNLKLANAEFPLLSLLRNLGMSVHQEHDNLLTDLRYANDR